MATTYKILGQITPASNTLTNAYTTGASASAILNTIYICNQEDANANVDLIVRPTADALSNVHFILKDHNLERADTLVLNLNITMNSNVVIATNNKFGLSSEKSANVSVSVFGAEIT